jgi:hypothetical protein
MKTKLVNARQIMCTINNPTENDYHTVRTATENKTLIYVTFNLEIGQTTKHICNHAVLLTHPSIFAIMRSCSLIHRLSSLASCAQTLLSCAAGR